MLALFLACPGSLERLLPKEKALQQVSLYRRQALTLPLGEKLKAIMERAKERGKLWKLLKERRELVDSLAVAIAIAEGLARKVGWEGVSIESYPRGATVREKLILDPLWAVNTSVTDMVVHEALHAYYAKKGLRVGEVGAALSVCLSGAPLWSYSRWFVEGRGHASILFLYLLAPFLSQLGSGLPYREERERLAELGKALEELPLREGLPTARAIMALVGREWRHRRAVEKALAKALEESSSRAELLVRAWEELRKLAGEVGVDYDVPKPEVVGADF